MIKTIMTSEPHVFIFPGELISSKRGRKQRPTISNYDELSKARVSPTLVLGALKQVMNQVEYMEMAKYAKAISSTEIRISESEKEDGE